MYYAFLKDYFFPPDLTDKVWFCLGMVTGVVGVLVVEWIINLIF